MPAQEDENRARVRQMIGRLNAGDLDAYLAAYHPDCVLYGYPPGLPPGRPGARQFYAAAVAAFPDVQLTLDDVIARGDRVAVRYTAQGTHSAPFFGVEATGRGVRWSGITILRFRAGLCVERWNSMDTLALLQQLGAVPAPERAVA